MCRIPLSIERDRVDRYTVVKWELIKQGLLSEGMLKMIYRWTLGACLFLTLIVTAGCSHIGYDLVNVPPQRHVIGGDMPQEEIFDTGKVKINYLDSGSPSAEPLIMLHGGAWRWQEYLSLIPSLSQRWHVYALDFRGNGRSEWVAGHYRLEDFAEDIVTFLRQLNEPAVLVGHSLGGAIALMAAARCPEKVKALIIEDAPLDLDTYKNVVDSSRDMFGLWLDLKKSASSENDLSLALADRYKDFPGVTSQWILFFAGCLWALDPTYFDALLYDFNGFTKGYGAEEIMAKIKCPVLFIRGETKLGAIVTDEEISRLTGNFSNVSHVQISGVGHLLHLEDRGQTRVLNEMMAFLKRIPK
jgi:pimeloyl-ACP methyl ester carboxylesterase